MGKKKRAMEKQRKIQERQSNPNSNFNKRKKYAKQAAEGRIGPIMKAKQERQYQEALEAERAVKRAEQEKKDRLRYLSQEMGERIFGDTYEKSEHYEAYGIEVSKRVFDLYNFNTDKIKIWNLNRGLPAYSEKMDLVIASRIIHHLEDPVTFIKQVRKIIKDNGWLMGVIPNICYYHHRIKFLLGEFPPISGAHINFQTGSDFQEMVNREGFRLQKLITPKKTIRAKLWPKLFSQDLIYVFQKK